MKNLQSIIQSSVLAMAFYSTREDPGGPDGRARDSCQEVNVLSPVWSPVSYWMVPTVLV